MTGLWSTNRLASCNQRDRATPVQSCRGRHHNTMIRVLLFGLLALSAVLLSSRVSIAETLSELESSFKTLYSNRSASFVCDDRGAYVDFRMLGTDWLPGHLLGVMELTPHGVDVIVLDAAGFSPTVSVNERSCPLGTMYRVEVKGERPYRCTSRGRDGASSLAAQGAWCVASFNLATRLLETGNFNFEFVDRESAERAAAILRKIAERV